MLLNNRDFLRELVQVALQRYQRSEKALVSTLMRMYLEGASTRKVRDGTEVLCGTSFSRSTVNGLVKTLDADLSAWRGRPLGEVACAFVLGDATYQHVRVAGQVVSQAALIVLGVRDDGKSEMLAVSATVREIGPDYEDRFRGLRARGLRGVKLVVSDDHAGLRSAIQRNFPWVAWQRCQVHFQSNPAARVARKHRAALMADVRAVCHSPAADMARGLAFQVAERWRASHPKVAELLKEGIDACLNVYALPPHWRYVKASPRTTSRPASSSTPAMLRTLPTWSEEPSCPAILGMARHLRAGSSRCGVRVFERGTATSVGLSLSLEATCDHNGTSGGSIHTHSPEQN